VKKRSKWVETEVECGGRVFLLPVRCRIETQRGRLRTCIQRKNSLTKKWHADHTTRWLPTVGASRVTVEFLDVMAQRMADKLIKDIEAGPMHSDWRI